MEIIKENSESEAAIRQTEATAPEKEFSNNSIAQSPNSVKSKFSDRDSQGNELSKEQREIKSIPEDEYETLEKHFGVTSNFKVAGTLVE